MEALADRLVLVLVPSPLLFWVLGSLVVYVLGTGILWLLKRPQLPRSLYGRWLHQIGRFLFFLGIPYLALGGWPRHPFQGLLSLGDLGLVGLNEHWTVTRWLEAAGTGLGLGFLALVVLVLAWASAIRRLCFTSRPWWGLLVDGLYLEVHWAFYRGALTVVLDDVYVGVFLGLALVYLEWGLDPFWRQGWRLPSRAAERWLRAALALVMSLLFLHTRNLWVCVVVHWLLELAFWRLGCGPIRSADAQTPEICC